MLTKNVENKLFDINKFPLQEGILIFGISMSKISNSQSAKKCFEYIKYLVKKIEKPQVGLNFVYSDYLYFNSDEKACVLKNRYLAQIHSHKNQFEKVLNKNKWYIQKSFSFTTWNQLVIDIKNWTTLFIELKKIYKKDKKFQKYINEDSKQFNRPLDENQLNFLLEEILFFLLGCQGKN